MFKFNNKMLFFFILKLSILMMMFNNNWFSMWFWLEMNLISFIAIMINFKNFMKLESSLIYFLMQTIASILFLYSLIMMKIDNNLCYMMLIALLIKLSMAPFHFWMPIMIESMNWMCIFMLLTIQKIGPLMLMNLFNKNMNLMMFIIISFIIGSIMGMNFSSIKKIMSYSSINQMSWIMYSLMFLNIYFKIYFLLYLYLMFITIYNFSNLKTNYLNQMFMLKMNKTMMIFLFSNLLSMGGLPPFMGFFMKMLIMMKMKNSMLMMLMMFFSLITLFYYIRIIMSIMMMNSNKLIMKKNYIMNYKMKFIIKISFINNFMIMFMLLLI